MSPETILAVIGTAVVAAAVALAVRHFVPKRMARDKLQLATADADRTLEDAQTRSKVIILEAKEEALRVRREAEEDQRERRAELQRREQRLQQREENIDRRSEAIDRRDRALAQREKAAEETRLALEELHKQAQYELQRISGLTPEQAQERLLASIEGEVREESGRRVRDIEQQAKEEGERRARWIVAQSIQRVAAEHTVETTQSVVALPNEEMKGRIIGKEGRNIRALEAATGVDLIIDDTPETVVLSSFDPVRREVARVALGKLMLDGRIHPARIEELVSKARAEVEANIREEGERAAYEVGVHGLHPELIKTIGRLKFRTSYAQNVLAHSVEVALLAGAMAAELRADVNVAKRAGFLHDIGKAVDHEVEGPHALVGGELARRHGVPPKVCHAIAAHHFEEEPQTVEAFLVAAADAISASRPGARRETVEAYIKRLQVLEDVVRSFAGVEKCYALQAGREVRVMVRPEQVDELEVWRLTRDIIKQIEETVEIPGQIRVTVIRETRVVDYAK